MFAARGLRSTTVRDVLAEEEISRRTFYLYFPNTDAVLGDLYCELAIYCRCHRAGTVEADPATQISEAIRAYVDVHVDGGPLGRCPADPGPDSLTTCGP